MVNSSMCWSMAAKVLMWFTSGNWSSLVLTSSRSILGGF